MSKPENQGNTKTISVLKEKKIYRKIITRFMQKLNRNYIMLMHAY